MLLLLYHYALQHYPKFKLPMILATKWIEVTWPSTILKYHSEAAQRFGEFLQIDFPIQDFVSPMFADHRDSATKTRAAARPNPWRVDLRLDPNTTLKTYKLLPKTTSPKNRTNHKACPRALHAERVAMTDKFRPKIWTIVQIFGLLLLQRIPAIWPAKSHPPHSGPRVGICCWDIYFRCRDLLKLGIETQRGLSFEAQTALDAPNLIA